MRVNYKGFFLEPTSEQLLENNKWTMSVRIENHKGSHVISKEFSGEKNFDSKEESEKFSVIFGKQIIDGLHKQISISELL